MTLDRHENCSIKAVEHLVPGIDVHGYDPDFSRVVTMGDELGMNSIEISASDRNHVKVTRIKHPFDSREVLYHLTDRHDRGMFHQEEKKPLDVPKQVWIQIVKILDLQSQLQTLRHSVYDALVPHLAPLTETELDAIRQNPKWKNSCLDSE